MLPLELDVIFWSGPNRGGYTYHLPHCDLAVGMAMHALCLLVGKSIMLQMPLIIGVATIRHSLAYSRDKSRLNLLLFSGKPRSTLVNFTIVSDNIQKLFCFFLKI